MKKLSIALILTLLSGLIIVDTYAQEYPAQKSDYVMTEPAPEVVVEPTEEKVVVPETKQPVLKEEKTAEAEQPKSATERYDMSQVRISPSTYTINLIQRGVDVFGVMNISEMLVYYSFAKTHDDREQIFLFLIDRIENDPQSLSDSKKIEEYLTNRFGRIN